MCKLNHSIENYIVVPSIYFYLCKTWPYRLKEYNVSKIERELRLEL